MGRMGLWVKDLEMERYNVGPQNIMNRIGISYLVASSRISHLKSQMP